MTDYEESYKNYLAWLTPRELLQEYKFMRFPWRLSHVRPHGHFPKFVRHTRTHTDTHVLCTHTTDKILVKYTQLLLEINPIIVHIAL